MRYYPVFLDIAGKPVIVIGGGNIAHQKVVGLLKAGAEVTVVSPELNSEMASLATAATLSGNPSGSTGGVTSSSPRKSANR